MIRAQGDELPSLQRQAKRLRFDDAALENTFDDERLTTALGRARVLVPIGILATVVVGLGETLFGATERNELFQRAVEVRFGGSLVPWILIYVSTFLPGHRRRADWLGALGTIVVCWSLALRYWHFALAFPDMRVAGLATGAVLSVLMISMIALTLSFRALVTATVAAFGGTVLFYWLTLPPERAGEIVSMAMRFTGVAGMVAFLGWYRESADRLTFGQREYVKRLNAELARLNAEKNEFIAIASHDLRSPLATVHGLAEQLAHGRLEATPELHGAIRDHARRMLQLVEDYLGAHAIEQGALLVRMRPIDLAGVAREAAERHRLAAEAKRLRLVVEAGEPVRARGDAGLLAQVLDNFLGNAVKFSPAEKTVRVAVSVAEDGRSARIEVIDQGPGVAAEDQAKLFRKFQRAEAVPTGGETGYGLGLAVAKRLAETMGGSVGCESRVGDGATFWVALPTAES